MQNKNIRPFPGDKILKSLLNGCGLVGLVPLSSDFLGVAKLYTTSNLQKRDSLIGVYVSQEV